MLNERELRARYDVALEQYNKTINIEAQLMVLMANRYILPAAYRYQAQVGAERGRGEGGRRDGEGSQARRSTSWSQLTDEFKVRVDKLQALLEHEGTATPRSTRSTSATRSCRRWSRSAKPATASSASCRTTCGRCRRIARCCSSVNASVSGRSEVKDIEGRWQCTGPPDFLWPFELAAAPLTGRSLR